ncbi:MAG TPA: M3 family oligoendopeptidase [Edaphocola sp.]|nr:M3 family oligoendopeptidase [Edaphocola sp.]
MITVPARRFLPGDFKITEWNSLLPYYENLNNRPIDNTVSLEAWLKDWSELEAVISEDACWRQIRMTCDTTDPELDKAFAFFCQEIEPNMKPWSNRLQKKLMGCPFTKELDPSLYFPFLRSIKNALALYREGNIPLEAELNMLAQQFGQIAGAMMVSIEGKEYTLQQAAKFLHQSDRVLRETAFTRINDRRLEDKDALDELFDKLLALRHQVAVNAGFDNYRDYKFKALGRFDYSPEDCFAFHEAVKKHILPLQERILEFRRRRLGLARLKPFDTAAVPEGEKPLHPFENGQELLNKGIETFTRLQPFLGSCLQTMKDMNRLDLDSRKGKAPGGYNCPLAETGVPFIFMNAAATMSDVITLMHEGGHAVHSFLCHNLPLSFFKEYPMEIAELASMSMELFSMKEWAVYFNREDELLRARQEELERVIDVLPWIAIIDKFQHWLYTHPGHSRQERSNAWQIIQDEFSARNIDWNGLEKYREHNWQKQLHLFEVPFYYIEYGIAQLGAIAMWRQFKKDETAALENYKKALSCGNTKTLPELYRAAGIEFDFSPDYVSELKSFLEKELTALGL